MVCLSHRSRDWHILLHSMHPGVRLDDLLSGFGFQVMVYLIRDWNVQNGLSDSRLGYPGLGYPGFCGLSRLGYPGYGLSDS